MPKKHLTKLKITINEVLTTFIKLEIENRMALLWIKDIFKKKYH